MRVGAVLLDDAGQEVARAEGLVALDLVDVDERAPFAVLFGEQPGKFARYQVFALRAVPAYVGSYYRDLEVNDIASVSYTHLRAHETVLDLVCRLLLEKKKHTIVEEKHHIHTHTTPLMQASRTTHHTPHVSISRLIYILIISTKHSTVRHYRQH